MGQAVRTPRDGRARVRLLEAQRAEAKALVAVERAVAVRERAQRKLARTMAVQERQVAAAEQRVSAAQAALVEVSGIQRTAQLLDLPARVLRIAVKEAAEPRSQVDDDADASKIKSRPAASVDEV